METSTSGLSPQAVKKERNMIIKSKYFVNFIEIPLCRVFKSWSNNTPITYPAVKGEKVAPAVPDSYYRKLV